MSFLVMLFYDAQIQNKTKVEMNSSTEPMVNPGSLYRRFQRLKDESKAKGKRYALATNLVGLFLAKLCGEDKPSSGIAQVLGLKRDSMASHHTYRRVWADGIDPEELESLVQQQHCHCRDAGYQVVGSMDGRSFGERSI